MKMREFFFSLSMSLAMSFCMEYYNLIKCWWCKLSLVYRSFKGGLVDYCFSFFHSGILWQSACRAFNVEVNSTRKNSTIYETNHPKNMYGLCHVPNDVCYLINFI